jgi:hypothetical protein
MKELPNPTFPISQIALPRGSLHQSPQNQISASSSKNSKSAIKVSWAKHQDEVRKRKSCAIACLQMKWAPDCPPPLQDMTLIYLTTIANTCWFAMAETEAVIGTYRVLTPVQAKRVGGTYTDTEFDLTRLRFYSRTHGGVRPQLCSPRASARRGHIGLVGRFV